MNEFILMFFLLLGFKAYANEVPRGNSNAMVQIEMFADYQCPFTNRGYENLNNVIKDDSLSSSFTIKNFPLEFHDQAQLAAKIAICSEDQNKFWEVSDAFFALQSKNKFTEKELWNTTKILKLNQDKLKICVNGRLPEKILSDDKRDAQKYKVMGTPYMIIHGPKGDKILNGAYPVDEIKKAINEVL